MNRIPAELRGLSKRLGEGSNLSELEGILPKGGHCHRSFAADSLDGELTRALDAAIEQDDPEAVQLLLRAFDEEAARHVLKGALLDPQAPKTKILAALLEKGELERVMTSDSHAHNDFRSALHDFAGSPIDYSERLSSIIERANEIGRKVGGSHSTHPRVLSILEYALEGAAHHGHLENVRALLALARPVAIERTLQVIARWGVSHTDSAFRNLADKAELLFDSVSNNKVRLKSLEYAAQEGNLNVFKRLYGRFEADQSAKDRALLAAAKVPDDGCHSVPHIKLMLGSRAVWSDAVLLEALTSAIAAGSPKTVSILARKADEIYPGIMNNTTTSDGEPWLLKASRHARPEVASQLVGALFYAGTFPLSDELGRNPIDVLTKAGQEKSELVRDMLAVREGYREVAKARLLEATAGREAAMIGLLTKPPGSAKALEHK